MLYSFRFRRSPVSRSGAAKSTPTSRFGVIVASPRRRHSLFSAGHLCFVRPNFGRVIVGQSPASMWGEPRRWCALAVGMMMTLSDAICYLARGHESRMISHDDGAPVVFASNIFGDAERRTAQDRLSEGMSTDRLVRLAIAGDLLRPSRDGNSRQRRGRTSVSRDESEIRPPSWDTWACAVFARGTE